MTQQDAGACVMHVCTYEDALFLMLLSTSVFAAVFFFDFCDWLEAWLRDRKRT